VIMGSDLDFRVAIGLPAAAFRRGHFRWVNGMPMARRTGHLLARVPGRGDDPWSDPYLRGRAGAWGQRTRDKPTVLPVLSWHPRAAVGAPLGVARHELPGGC
jgi:hypothetical protein